MQLDNHASNSIPTGYVPMLNTIRFTLLMIVLAAAVTFFALITLTSRKQTIEELRANETFRSILMIEAEVIGTSEIIKEQLINYANSQLISGHEKFDDERLASIWQLGSHFLLNVGVAPKNVLTQIWPPEGNEQALGLNLEDLSEQWEKNRNILQKQHSLMTGPFKLVQGGTGIIISIPLYTETGAYWGQASEVISLEKLGAKLQSVAGNGATITLMQGGKVWFTGSNTPDEPGSNRYFFRLQNLDLGLAVVVGPQESASEVSNYGNEITIVTLLLFVVLVFALTYWSRLNEEKKVLRLQSFLDAARDPMLVVDQFGDIESYNKRALTLFATDKQASLTGNISQFVPSLAVSANEPLTRSGLHDQSNITILTNAGTKFLADLRIGANSDADVNQVFITIRLLKPVIDDRPFNDSQRTTAATTT